MLKRVVMFESCQVMDFFEPLYRYWILRDRLGAYWQEEKHLIERIVGNTVSLLKHH